MNQPRRLVVGHGDRLDLPRHGNLESPVLIQPRRVDPATRRGFALLLAAGILASSCVAPGGLGPTSPEEAGPSEAELSTALGRIAHFADVGLASDYPADWELRPQGVNMHYVTVIAFVGTAPSEARCESFSNSDGTSGTTCGTNWNLEPGTVSVELSTGNGPPHPPLFEWAISEGATRATIDGLPALVGPIYEAPDADLVLGWRLSMPEEPMGTYTLQAAIRGPGIDARQAQVEALVASIRYDPPVPSLDTGAPRAAAAARALETLTASDPAFACFPQEIGASAEATITAVPFYAPLRKPLPVTCSTGIEATPIGLWRLILTLSWEAAEERTAGSLVTRVWVHPDGTPGGAEGGAGLVPYT